MASTSLVSLRSDTKAISSPERSTASARFFKTGPGQYGAGDTFIGVSVPDQRKIARRYPNLPLTDIEQLLNSPIHEERLTTLIILVRQFQQSDEATQKTIYDFYLTHTARINNWDLVDSSAEFIVGPWLKHRDKAILQKLAKSDLIWERRIAMLSTFHYIKQGQPDEAFAIATLLLHDPHDLMHKAVGWMLREIGKRCSREIEEAFLVQHYRNMPRTMLRYAIEHFPEERRQQYLKGEA
jgi:3-methyladenine DNA glycosylase AlkD